MASLIGTNLTIIVNEPEEFYFENGEGPFKGTIVSEQDELLAIKLNEALRYNKKEFLYMVASLRHENASKEDLLNKGIVFVNLIPILTEKQIDETTYWMFDVVRRWRGGHLIGELRTE